MKSSTFIVFTFIILFLQLGVVAALNPIVLIPNIALLALIWLTFNATFWDTLLFSLVTGFFIDIFSIGPFGVNIVAAILTTIVLFWLLRQILPKEERFLVVLGSVEFAILCYQVISAGTYYSLLALHRNLEIDLIRFFNFNFLIQLILSIFVYYVFRSIVGRYLHLEYEKQSIRT